MTSKKRLRGRLHNDGKDNKQTRSLLTEALYYPQTKPSLSSAYDISSTSPLYWDTPSSNSYVTHKTWLDKCKPASNSHVQFAATQPYAVSPSRNACSKAKVANSKHASSVAVIPVFSWQYSTPLSIYLHLPHVAHPFHQPVCTLDVGLGRAEKYNFSSPSDRKS